MPTGYTAGVADGTVTTLREFAFRCARGMGVLGTMRDEPLNAPIPEKLEPYSYYVEQLADAQARLAELRAMTPEAVIEATADRNLRNEEYRQELVRENDARRARYEQLIAETEAWQGAPEGLKKFMLDQLRQSLDVDVSPEPLKWTKGDMTPAEWLDDAAQQALRNVEYYEQRYAEEVKRTNECNAWLAQLRASLPAVEEKPNGL